MSTAFPQAITSVRNGNWNDPSVWSPAVVPQSDNSSTIVVDHHIVVPDGYLATVDELTINHTLEIADLAECRLENGDGHDMVIAANGRLLVSGRWVALDGASSVGTSITSTRFLAGSVYRHQGSVEGVVPEAEWNAASTFELTGLEGNITLQSASWSQPFGNFIYDCPAQGQFVEFKGLLREIQGNFIVRNTNRSVLRLAQSQNLNLDVGGDIIIEGPSEVWFGMSGNSTIHVGGDFIFGATSTASSYFTTTGTTICTIDGDLMVNAVHRLKMASSTATGVTTIELAGDLNLADGTLDALGSGSGIVRFTGDTLQQLLIDNESAQVEGNVSFEIATGADVEMGSSSVSGSGDFVVHGKIALGSHDSGGVIQNGAGGNISVTGEVLFSAGSQVRLTGTQQQRISNTDFGMATVKMMNTGGGVWLSTDVQFHHLEIVNGQLLAGGHVVAISGNVSCVTAGQFHSSGMIRMNGTDDQTLDLNGIRIPALEIDNEGSEVSLLSSIEVSHRLQILSEGTKVQTNGFLTLLSLDATPSGSASVNIIPAESMITGSVLVQRFMNSIQGGYRYISAPVVGATVASLIDDVPVTGSFDDPSVVDGVSAEPSLFFFDPLDGEWQPYPVSGTAGDNPFLVGTGYCFYDYNNELPTMWDLSGELFQGPLTYNLTFSTTGDEETDGWNLVGNPYPSAVVWGGTGWTRNESVSMGIAVRDNEFGGFRYWDGATGNLPDGRIAMGQSFWVYTNAPDPVLIIDEQAKANDGGQFFRERDPDVLELAISIGEWEDQSFLRLKPGALTMFDSFDVPKLKNDHLSISFLTADGRAVAISAVETIDCHFGVPVRVEVDEQSQGEFSLRVRAEGVFSTVDISLFDSVSGRRYYFDGDGILRIPKSILTAGSVTLSIESLELKSFMIKAPEEVCQGDSLQIRFQDHPDPTRVYLTTLKGEWDPVHTGDRLIFSPEALEKGENHMALWAYNACGNKLLIDSLHVMSHAVVEPHVTDGFSCGEGSIILHANRLGPGELWWYENMVNGQRIGRGEEFQTPWLGESRVYYVLSRFGSCESKRVPVAAVIYPSVTADLRFHDRTLATTAEGVYRWYFNDRPLEWEENWVDVTLPGRYTLEVTSGRCSATSAFDYMITGVGNERSAEMVVFPNPCHDTLIFSIRENETITEIVVRSVTGDRLVFPGVSCESDACKMSTTSLASGMYVLQIRTDKNVYVTRFVKW